MSHTAASTRSVVVASAVAFAIGVSLLTMLVAPKIAEAATHDPDEAVTTDVTAEAVHDPTRTLQPGTTIAYGGWEVSVGEPVWEQTEAVWKATRYPDRALVGHVNQWVTAPVMVTNTSDTVDSFTSVDVELHDQGHRWHHSLRERQTMPDELNERAFEPGETRSGNIGWILRDAEKDQPCQLQVTFTDADVDERTYRISCGAQASS